MSEQDGIQSSTKQRRSRKISSDNNLYIKHARIAQRPTNDDKEAWKAYWKTQEQPWRTEPEIDTRRQVFLDERRFITPNIEQGIYPFKDIKLSRADLEWLLVTHGNGRGPVDWNEESQRKQDGLDLCGADLRQEDLSNLPLTCFRGGLDTSDDKLMEMAAVRLEEANLTNAHLESAYLIGSHLEKALRIWADCRYAHFEDAYLNGAYLASSNFTGAYLENVHIAELIVTNSQNFEAANLEGAVLIGVNLKHAYLQNVNLKKALIGWGHFENASLSNANLSGATLSEVHLEGANLNNIDLREAFLQEVHLEKALLNRAHLEGANLSRTHLEKAVLCGAFLEKTMLGDAFISDEKHVGPHLADVHWNDANLAIVKWSRVDLLGDEYEARQKYRDGKLKDRTTRLDEYERAVRANRQLAVALQSQGLNEDAARFSYYAQKLQRTVILLQGGVGSFKHYLFSLFLDLLAGYGYKPWRSFLAYLIVITAFATAYFVVGRTVGPALSPLSSLVFSLTSFHGRGFFPSSNISLDDPLTVLAAIEAFVGLVIEVTFIATLTQRLFGK